MRRTRLHIRRKWSRQRTDRDRTNAIINTLGNLATTLTEIDGIEEAEEWVTLGLSLARKLGDRETIVSMLNTAGAAAEKRGDDVAAEKYFREALLGANSLSSYPGLSPLLMNLAMTVARRGHYQEAEEHLSEILPGLGAR